MTMHFYVSLYIVTTAHDFRSFSDIGCYVLKTVRMQCTRQLAPCLKIYDIIALFVMLHGRRNACQIETTRRSLLQHSVDS